MEKRFAFIEIPQESKEYHLLRFREEAAHLGVDLVEIDPLNTQIVMSPNGVRLLDQKGDFIEKCIAVYRKAIGIPNALAIQEILIEKGANSIFSKTQKRLIGKIADYLFLSSAKIQIPKTFVVTQINQIEACVSYFKNKYPLIIKPALFSSKGVGTMIVDNKQTLVSVLEYLFSICSEPFLVQEVIKNSLGKDIRAIVLDNKVIAAIKRENKDRDFRANVARGGKAVAIKLTEEQEKLAIKAAKVFNYKFAGVDLLYGKDGPLVSEVNSPCGFEAAEKNTNVNITRKLIQSLIGK